MNLAIAKDIVRNLPNDIKNRYKDKFVTTFGIPLKFTPKDLERISTPTGLDKQVKRIKYEAGFVYFLDHDGAIKKFLHKKQT